jgi:uncharacterized membrane protein YedE/YeeE
MFALLAGITFGAGLTISDMVNPARVLNFLDVAGTWDPTLIFVIAGALGVTIPGYRLVFSRQAPVVGGKFAIPTLGDIDLPLVCGSALFGVGWGLTGICPGPALTDVVMIEPKIYLFIAAMLLGMFVARKWQDRRSATTLRQAS